MARAMTLGEMISTLSRKDQNASIRYDFVHFYPTTIESWRGVYAELAIGYSNVPDPEEGYVPIVAQFLAKLKEAVGKEYHGWKGGEYIMHENTPMHVANSGEAGNTIISDIIEGDREIVFVTAFCRAEFT